MDGTSSEPLVIGIPRGSRLADLDEHLALVPAGDARMASSFVLRLEGPLAEQLSASTAAAERRRLVRRARGKDIRCVFPAGNGQDIAVLGINSEGLGTVPDAATAVAQARQADLHHLITATADHCYFRAGEGYHFVTPAGLHCTHFLRLSDAIRNRGALEALAFWLRPRLMASRAVLVDSWSIVGVALFAREECPDLRHFDCLPGHPSRLNGQCRAVLRGIEDKLAPGEKLTVLTSVSSSGTLQTSMRELLAFDRKSEPEVEFLSIYGFRGSEAEALCVLPDTPENYFGIESCEHCENGSVPLAIDPRLYYVRDREEREVPIRKGHWEIGRQFVETYGHAVGSFASHVDDPNDGRHHAFAIDVLRLIDDEAFRASFRRAIDTLDINAQHVIVVPNHDAGRALASIASEVTGAQVVVSNNLRAESVVADDRLIIEQTPRLVILDDVVNSGSRLEEFNTAIREDWGGRFERVSFLVGIARTESHDELLRIDRSLTMNHPWDADFTFAEQIFLPRWGRADCPWCHEYEFLSAISAKSPTPPEWLSDRLAQLSDTLCGLRTTPFLVPPNRERVALGAGGLAGPKGLSEGPLLFSVVSAIQALRYDPNPAFRLNPGYPFGNVAGLKNLQLYSEGLMRMSLLRLLRGPEWGMTWNTSVRQFLRNVIRRSEQRLIVGELLIAQARQAVPAYTEHDFGAIVSAEFPGLDVRRGPVSTLQE